MTCQQAVSRMRDYPRNVLDDIIRSQDTTRKRALVARNGLDALLTLSREQRDNEATSA